jgi:hypothetical protein
LRYIQARRAKSLPERGSTADGERARRNRPKRRGRTTLWRI